MGVPGVDVYALPPGGDINSSSPIVPNLSFGEVAPASGQEALEPDAGSYVLYLTVTGTKAIAYQSKVVHLKELDSLLISAVSVGPPDGVKLLVVGKFGKTKFLDNVAPPPPPDLE